MLAAAAEVMCKRATRQQLLRREAELKSLFTHRVVTDHGHVLIVRFVDIVCDDCEPTMDVLCVTSMLTKCTTMCSVNHA